MTKNKDLAEQLTSLTDNLSDKIGSLTGALSDIADKVKAAGSEGGDLHELIVAAQNTAKGVSGDFADLRKKLTD